MNPTNIHPRNERVLVHLIEPDSAVILASIDSDTKISSSGYLEVVEAAPDCKHGPYPAGTRVLVLPGANVFRPKGLPDYGILHETSIVAIDEREPAIAEPGSN